MRTSMFRCTIINLSLVVRCRKDCEVVRFSGSLGLIILPSPNCPGAFIFSSNLTECQLGAACGNCGNVENVGACRACLRACSSSVLFMPGRAGASWAFPGSGNLTQLRVTDETATIILIVYQRDFHRVVTTFKPQFKSLVCHQ